MRMNSEASRASRRLFACRGQSPDRSPDAHSENAFENREACMKRASAVEAADLIRYEAEEHPDCLEMIRALHAAEHGIRESARAQLQRLTAE